MLALEFLQRITEMTQEDFVPRSVCPSVREVNLSSVVSDASSPANESGSPQPPLLSGPPSLPSSFSSASTLQPSSRGKSQPRKREHKSINKQTHHLRYGRERGCGKENNILTHSLEIKHHSTFPFEFRNH